MARARIRNRTKKLKDLKEQRDAIQQKALIDSLIASGDIQTVSFDDAQIQELGGSLNPLGFLAQLLRAGVKGSGKALKTAPKKAIERKFPYEGLKTKVGTTIKDEAGYLKDALLDVGKKTAKGAKIAFPFAAYQHIRDLDDLILATSEEPSGYSNIPPVADSRILNYPVQAGKGFYKLVDDISSLFQSESTETQNEFIKPKMVISSRKESIPSPPQKEYMKLKTQKEPIVDIKPDKKPGVYNVKIDTTEKVSTVLDRPGLKNRVDSLINLPTFNVNAFRQLKNMDDGSIEKYLEENFIDINEVIGD